MAKYFNKLVDWLSTKTAEKLIAMSILIILWDIVFFLRSKRYALLSDEPRDDSCEKRGCRKAYGG